MILIHYIESLQIKTKMTSLSDPVEKVVEIIVSILLCFSDACVPVLKLWQRRGRTVLGLNGSVWGDQEAAADGND